MIKRYSFLLFVVLLLLPSLVQAHDVADKHIHNEKSDSVFSLNQFVEKIQSVFNLGEKSSELSTAEKYYKLANRQLLEAEKEVNEKEIQKAIKNIKEFNKYFKLTIQELVKAKDNGADISNFLEKINKTKIRFDKLKEKIKKPNEFGNNINKTPKPNEYDKTKENVEIVKSPSLDKSPTPVSAVNNYGKPGMDDSSTQVARPKGISSSCSKLYLCKINCGKDIINNCNHDSANKLYTFLNCRGECIHYNLFYGCGMDQGCDSSCWNVYENSCGPFAYQDCVEKCDSDFSC